MSRYDPASMRDALELVSALALGETTTAVHLASRGAVAVYRKRYADFPAPVVDMGAGRCLLWHRADIAAWAKRRS